MTEDVLNVAHKMYSGCFFFLFRPKVAKKQSSSCKVINHRHVQVRMLATELSDKVILMCTLNTRKQITFIGLL